MSEFTVTLTVTGIHAEEPERAVEGFEALLGIDLPAGTVLAVRDEYTGESVDVEVDRVLHYGAEEWL